jgi:hypothetical protein
LWTLAAIIFACPGTGQFCAVCHKLEKHLMMSPVDLGDKNEGLAGSLLPR